jgi:hypothetical protein
VFRDLMAYSCTFEHCNSGLFESRIAWKSHELAEHRRDWQCPSCRRDFGTRDFVVRHMSAEHPATEDGLVHALVTAGSPEHTSAKISDCPFCDDCNARPNLLYLEPTPQGEQTSHEFSIPIDIYQRHLSRHMEQLALFAVPPANDDGDDEGSNGGEDAITASDEDNNGEEDDDDDDSDDVEQPWRGSDNIVSSVASRRRWSASGRFLGEDWMETTTERRT